MIAAIGLAGCESAEPRTLEIVEQAHPDGVSAYTLTVLSCGPRPEVSRVVESDQTVEVEVVATTAGATTDECLDSARLELDGPIGDRALVDMTSGRTIPMAQYATEP